MDQKRLEYLRQVERHADETGWVAPLPQEDKDHFAYLRKVFKRYNIAPSKATPTEYDFVVRVAESEFILLDFLDRLKGETAIAVSPFMSAAGKMITFTIYLHMLTRTVPESPPE